MYHNSSRLVAAVHPRTVGARQSGLLEGSLACRPLGMLVSERQNTWRPRELSKLDPSQAIRALSSKHDLPSNLLPKIHGPLISGWYWVIR